MHALYIVPTVSVVQLLLQLYVWTSLLLCRTLHINSSITMMMLMMIWSHMYWRKKHDARPCSVHCVLGRHTRVRGEGRERRAAASGAGD